MSVDFKEMLKEVERLRTLLNDREKHIKILGICINTGWLNGYYTNEIPYSQIFQDYGNQYITILQRG
ncbi:MAG: hypothetical protein ACK55Z_00090, partial [bacterium]